MTGRGESMRRRARGRASSTDTTTELIGTPLRLMVVLAQMAYDGPRAPCGVGCRSSSRWICAPA